MGNHDELMALRGFYARLYNMNYASFDDIDEAEFTDAANASTT